MINTMELCGHAITTRKNKTLPGTVFSILIPTWNNLGYLQNCIRSLRKYSAFQHQIIVHINEGADGTLEWIEQQPDLDYTYSKQNLGVCHALNTARLLAETDYLVYLNDDMFVCPDWDRVLWEEVQAIGHKYFFISSTAIEPVPQSNCSIRSDFGRTVQTFREDELMENYLSVSKPDWYGATWPPNLVHKDVWDMVGGYSVEFSPGMYSDPDFSMKLWHAGIRIFKGVGKSRVYHFGSVSTRRVKNNPGYRQFIAKWGVTSSTLTKHYLKRGVPYKGPLQDSPVSAWIKWKNYLKRLQLYFNSY